MGRKLQLDVEARAAGGKGGGRGPSGGRSGGSKTAAKKAPPPPPKKPASSAGTPTSAAASKGPRKGPKIASVIPDGLVPSFNYPDDDEEEFEMRTRSDAETSTSSSSSLSEEMDGELKPSKIPQLSPKVRTARYVSSAVDLASCPPAT